MQKVKITYNKSLHSSVIYEITKNACTRNSRQVVEYKPHKGTSDSVGYVASMSYETALMGFFLGSRVNQRRYIWTDESKCNVSELGDLETKNELSVLVKQHLDELFYSANRNGVKAPAHMETVGHGFPPTSSCSNHVKVDGDTLAEAESSPFNGGLLCLKLN